MELVGSVQHERRHGPHPGRLGFVEGRRERRRQPPHPGSRLFLRKGGRRPHRCHTAIDRRYDAAIAELHTVLQMDPTYAHGHFRLGQVLLVMGRAREAVPELQTAVEMTKGSPAALGLLAMAFDGSGQRAEAARILGELEGRAATEHVPPGALLLAYLAVGARTRAIEMLARGYEERDNYQINIVADPLMDPLRNEPRFQAICRQVMLGSELDWSALAAPETPVARR